MFGLGLAEGAFADAILRKTESTQVQKAIARSFHSLQAGDRVARTMASKATQSFAKACVTVLNECDMKTLYQTGFISERPCTHAPHHGMAREWSRGKNRSYHIDSLWEIYENGIAGGRTSDTVSHGSNGAAKMEWQKPLNGNSVKLF